MPRHAKTKTRRSTAMLHVQRAERAWSAGRCLPAGQEIDRAYFALGRRMNKAVQRRLHNLDEKFERACVRPRPMEK